MNKYLLWGSFIFLSNTFFLYSNNVPQSDNSEHERSIDQMISDELIDNDSYANALTRTTVPSLTVTENLVVDGSFTLDSTRIFDYKLPSTLSTSATTILTINFTNVAGSSASVAKGAFVKIQCYINGTISSIASELFFEGNYYIMPGATSSTSCTQSLLREYTLPFLGNTVTMTSGISGTGTTAIITLATSSTISNQNFLMFYEVTSNNLSSVV